MALENSRNCESLQVMGPNIVLNCVKVVDLDFGKLVIKLLVCSSK